MLNILGFTVFLLILHSIRALRILPGADEGIQQILWTYHISGLDATSTLHSPPGSSPLP